MFLFCFSECYKNKQDHPHNLTEQVRTFFEAFQTVKQCFFNFSRVSHVLAVEASHSFRLPWPWHFHSQEWSAMIFSFSLSPERYHTVWRTWHLIAVQMKSDSTINSHYMTHMFVLEWLGEFILWAWEWIVLHCSVSKVQIICFFLFKWLIIHRLAIRTCGQMQWVWFWLVLWSNFKFYNYNRSVSHTVIG